jgi:hypothetical protein
LYCFLVGFEIKMKYMMSITCFQLCWALPPQGLSHWIQLLEVLPY